MDDLLEYECLVYSIINKYTKYFDKDDLYQVGMLGLMDAYKHFDRSRALDVKFSTYAYYYVLGKVKKYIRENNPIKISSNLIKLNQAIERARETMSQSLGRVPTTLELSLFLEISEEKIEEVRTAFLDIKSLDYSAEGEECEYYNSIASNESGMDSSILDLKIALEGLPMEEKALIVARYYDDLTQSEASRKLGISQAQVSRKETKILEKLKTVL